MADEEKNEQTEETPQDETSETAGPDASEEAQQPEAPAEEAEAPAAEEPAAPAEDDDTPWKERRRLERSRRPHEARPQLSPEDRDKERQEGRKRLAGRRRKRREAARAKKGEAGTGTPAAEHERNAAKVRQGIVVSDKANKTITVRIDTARRHPAYEKIVRRSRTLHAHDEQNEAGAGDTVRVIETRPLSKTKRWRLVEVVEKAK